MEELKKIVPAKVLAAVKKLEEVENKVSIKQIAILADVAEQTARGWSSKGRLGKPDLVAGVKHYHNLRPDIIKVIKDSRESQAKKKKVK